MAHSDSRPVFRRQEADVDRGRQAGRRVNGLKVGINLTGIRLYADLDLNLEIGAKITVRNIGREICYSRRQGYNQVSKPNFGHVKSGPIVVGAQLVNDIDLLGGRCGVGGVLKINAIRLR